MPMGWWRPFFFFDPTGVQLLLPWLVLDSAPSYALGALAIACLALADRRLAHASAPSGDNAQAALYTAQRASGTLVMLLLMSFNVPLIVWLLASLGAGERYCLYRRHDRLVHAGRSGGGGAGSGWSDGL